MNMEYKAISVLMTCFLIMTMAIIAVEYIGKQPEDDTDYFIQQCNAEYGVNNWTVDTVVLKDWYDYSGTDIYYNPNHTEEITVTVDYIDHMRKSDHPIVAVYDKSLCFFCDKPITRYTCFSKE